MEKTLALNQPVLTAEMDSISPQMGNVQF